jgi:hypothetical protein
MNYENDANLDPAAWLLFEILRGACIPANAAHCCSAKERLETYQKQFQAATRVLVWLDLAVAEETGPDQSAGISDRKINESGQKTPSRRDQDAKTWLVGRISDSRGTCFVVIGL